MNRKDFMEQLEKLLMDIPVEERVEAMAFYHSYFEDAGEENEERVIRELESPRKVAASIKADMNLEPAPERAEEEAKGAEQPMGNDGFAEDAQAAGSDNLMGYSRAAGGDGFAEDQRAETNRNAEGKSKKGTEDNTFKIVMIVIVAVLTSPIWIGLLGGLLGLVAGAAATILGCAVALIAVAFAFYLAAIALCSVSVMAFGAGAVGIGCGLFGAGLLILALAVLSTIVCVWVFGSFIPWAFGGIVSLCKRLFQKKQKGGYAA